MLAVRLASVAVLLPVVVVAFLLGTRTLVALIAVVAVLAAYETFRLIARAGYAVVPLFGTVVALGIVLSGALPDEPLAGPAAAAAAVLLAAMVSLASPHPDEGFRSWAATVFGALYVGLGWFALRIVTFAPSAAHATGPAAPLAWLGPGREWLVVLLAGVWSYDSAAYLVGRSIGRRRFMQHVSPSKTWEGVVGGLVGATAAEAVALAAIGQPPLGALVLGPLVGILAQAGDLAESMLKRAAGAKDSGRLIPGHGGMLDRVDSLLFAAPVVALYAAFVTR